MGVAGVNRRYASAAIFLFIGVWCWVALDRPYNFPSHIAWNIYSNSPQGAPVVDVFKTRPLISSPLKTLCEATTWNDNVTFVCDESFGGVVEVRYSILNCIRFTIAAGGSLVMPKIIVREEGGDPISRNIMGLEYMFDREHFHASVAQSCPQLRVYETVRHIPNAQDVLGPVSLLPESLVKNFPKAGAEEWGGLFYSWLIQHRPSNSVPPIIVELERTYLQYPIYSDGEQFANAFGKLLTFRADVRNLATMVLMKLSEAYFLPLDLSDSILRKAFMGAYISTVSVDPQQKIIVDPVNSIYTSQSRLYVSQATHANMSIIYAASDDEANFRPFINDGNQQGLAVTTKFNLHKGEEKEKLLGLTVDQQAMVDYLVCPSRRDLQVLGTRVLHGMLLWKDINVRS